MKKPLVCLASGLCLGIFLSYKLTLSFCWVYGAALIILTVSIFSIKKGLRADILLLCLFFLFGAVLLKDARMLPKHHIVRCISYKNNGLYTIKGFISSEPVFKNARASFIFNTQQIQYGNFKQNCTGPVLVYTKDKRNFKLGQDLVLTGTMARPYKPADSYHKSFRGYLYNQGIFYIMRTRAVRVAEISNSRYILRRLAVYLKSRMKERIARYTPRITAGILGAMVLGERRGIPPLINNNMVKSGTVHILVISGFHTGIVAFIIILILKLIRIPKKARFYIAVFLLIIYCLLTGVSAPVVRATVMAIVFLFAYLIRREPDIYNSLSLAAIFILGFNPRQLFDVGFQLSFISVFSIVYLYPKIRLLLHADAIRIKFLRFLIDGCLVSLSAWLGTMGFIACYFKIFSPVTVLANIFIVPIAALITLCGFSLIIMGFFCPRLAPFFAYTSELVCALMLGINNLLIKIPGAYFYLP